MLNLKNYEKDAKTSAEQAKMAWNTYIYGDFTQENTAARIGTGKDNLSLVDENFGKDKKGNLIFGKTESNGNGRNISITNIGDIDTMSVVLGHEAYRNGVIDANNKTETRTAVIAHTGMAARMRADGVQFGGIVGLDLAVYDYARAAGNMSLMDMYADAAYDSSGDYWKLVKKDNGEWDWEEDDSLDFNFDLNNKEIANAFYKTFGWKMPNKDGIVTISALDMYDKAGLLAMNLNIRDPEGTKYFYNPDVPLTYVSVSKFLSSTHEKGSVPLTQELIQSRLNIKDACAVTSTAWMNNEYLKTLGKGYSTEEMIQMLGTLKGKQFDSYGTVSPSISSLSEKLDKNKRVDNYLNLGGYYTSEDDVKKAGYQYYIEVRTHADEPGRTHFLAHANGTKFDPDTTSTKWWESDATSTAVYRGFKPYTPPKR